MSAKETLIKVENLQKYYKGGAIKALDGINTEIKKGEVVVVIGPSGSGKSTFLRCLNLLEVPTGGHILFEGTDITDEKTNINLHRQKMGMVFQHFNLFPHMTILKNMTIAPMKLLKKSEAEATEKAMELLGGNIRRFVACREDIEAAENMLVGSLFAGIAFSFARLGNVHAMSHPISAYFDVPHGVANAVLLPVIAEYNALADHGRYFKIFNYISPFKVDAGEFEPGLLPGAIRELCGEIGIPNGIVEAVNNASRNGPVSREAIEEKIEAMAADAMKSGNIAVNPRASRQSDIEMLYRRAL